MRAESPYRSVLLLVASLALSCASRTGPEGPVLTCLDDSFNGIVEFGPVVHELPTRVGPVIYFLAYDPPVSGTPDVHLGRIDTSGSNERGFYISDDLGSRTPRVLRVAGCPYDGRRLLVDRGGDRPLESWRVDDAGGLVTRDEPAGWPTAGLRHGVRFVSWLAGSTSGNDSIAVIDADSRAPGILLPQRDTVITDAGAFLPFSDDDAGRHRLSLRRGVVDELRLDGASLPVPEPGDRLVDARWAPGGRWLLLAFGSHREILRPDYWLVELDRRSAPRRFTTSPECLPILELEFLSDARLVASAIDVPSGQIFLYELSIDGHVLRRLTSP